MIRLVFLVVLFAAIRAVLNLARKWVQRQAADVDTVAVEYTVISSTPDAPRPFGYKTGWLAARTTDSAAVRRALGLKDPVIANWESGLELAGASGKVFVTPVLDGFVLVIGVTDLLSGTRRLDAIGRQFPEVQYFVTHRVTEYHGWARYEGGVCTRRYAWVGESGQVLCNDGPLTEQELSLGFARFPASDRDEAALLPGEEDVRRLAAAWGVDPNLSRHQDDRSTGYLCTLP